MLPVSQRMSASGIWTVSEADFPGQGSPRERLGFALKYALSAPLGLDGPACESRLTDTHLDLFAKEESAVLPFDPDRREAIIGCGVLLYRLKIALRHFGCLGRVELFPDLDQPELVARVHFGFTGARALQDKTLFEAMAAAPVIASAFDNAGFSSQALVLALNQTLVHERGWVEFAQSETTHRRLAEMLRTESQRLSARAVMADRQSSNWPRPLFAFGGQPPRREETVRPAKVAFDPNTTLAVVKTKTDDKHGWLAAGQTLARAALQAQALGVTWSLFDPIRQPDVREALRREVGHKGFAQIILRFGVAAIGEAIRLPAPATVTVTYR